MLCTNIIFSLLMVFFSCNSIAKQSDVQVGSFSKIKSSIAKPFKRKTPPAQVQQVQQPALLWIRLRNNFVLAHHENDPRVQYYIKRFTQSQVHFNELINNARPFLFFITEELEKRGMPGEIALLPMVESNFDPKAKSSSGARGLWQIMPDTGKYYGLSQDAWFDGCQDVVMSTKAALGHLDYLHKRFDGNWLLALAAYNSGEGRVMRAIRKNIKSKQKLDFWSLGLPKETRDYVPKLMALVAIIKTPSKYGVNLPHIMNETYFTQVDIGKAIDIKQAAKEAQIAEKKLVQLNPGFYKHKMNPDGPYHLCVPIQLAGRFTTMVETLPAVTKAPPKSHIIHKGDTLIKIAKKYNTNVKTLKEINQLKGDTIRLGQKINLPSHEAEALPKSKIHVVKKGETLWQIGKQYHVQVDKIMASNNLNDKSLLKPGQKIVIESA